MRSSPSRRRRSALPLTSCDRNTGWICSRLAAKAAAGRCLRPRARQRAPWPDLACTASAFNHDHNGGDLMNTCNPALAAGPARSARGIAGLLAVVLALAASQASAQWVVTDPGHTALTYAGWIKE